MTAIRDAVIRIRTEQVKAKLEAPDVGPAERAFKAEAKAAKEDSKAIEETNTARTAAVDSSRKFASETRRNLAESGAASTEFSRASVNAFRASGEGLLRFTRGVAFMSASSERDMQRMIQTVSAAQGAFDIFAGGAKTVTTLGTAFGPVGVAVGSVTALVAAGAIVWNRYENAGKEAAEARNLSLRETAKLLRDVSSLEQSRAAQAESLQRERIENIRDPKKRADAFRVAAEDERKSQNFRAGRNLFDEGRAKEDVGLQQAGINITKQAAENLRDEIEYRREAARIDQEINAKRAEAIEAAQRQLEAAKRTPSPFDDLTAGANVNKLTGGRSADSAIADLRAKNQQIASEAEATADRLLRMLERVTIGLNGMEDKVRKIEGAQY